MKNTLGLLLRNASPALVSAFIETNKAPTLDLPANKTERIQAVSAYLGALLDDSDGLFAQLRFEADRIQSLAKPHLDRYFQKNIAPEHESEIEPLDQRDRALWFYLNDMDAFEALERELSYDNLSAGRDKTTRFDTLKDQIPNYSPEAIEAFEQEVKRIYRLHDGSGKFVVSHPPTNGDDLDILSVSLSQPPSQLERFTEEGHAEDDIVRKITWIHLNYEPAAGILFVVTSRGGFQVRLDLSEAFAKILLNVDQAPAVSRKDELELKHVMLAEAVPAVPNQPDANIYIVEAIFRQWMFAGHRFTVQCADGLDQNLFKRLFGDMSTNLVIESVKFRIENYLPKGARKACAISATLHRDGSVTCPNHKTEQHHLTELLPSIWGLNPSAAS